jgi:hypothetical protein
VRVVRGKPLEQRIDVDISELRVVDELDVGLKALSGLPDHRSLDRRPARIIAETGS